MLLRLLIACMLISPAWASLQVKAEHTRLAVLVENEGLVAGEIIWLAFHFTLDKKWHTYWRNPGDSGEPARIKFKLPPVLKAGAIEWPVPQRIATGPLMTYGYENEMVLLVPLRAEKAIQGEQFEVAAEITWLECAEICLPASATWQTTLDVKTKGSSSVFKQKFFDNARQRLPRDSIELPYTASDQSMTIDLSGLAGDTKRAYYFSYKETVVDHPAEQKLAGSQLSVALVDQVKEGERFHGVLQAGESAYLVTLVPASWFNFALLYIIVFAFVGGLLLNLMPCVLPVLSLKVLALVEKASENPTLVKKDGWLFSAGVVLSFLALASVMLALRAAGYSVGWGFQLQSPGFVLALVFVFFIFGLNLLGTFEVLIPLPKAGPGTSAFFNGVLATIVATPCTAPLMGVALGAAIALPVLAGLGVFFFLGLGMASPYLLLAYVPSLRRFIPRPGDFMVTLKQFMGFLLMGTVVWLLYIYLSLTSQLVFLSAMVMLLMVAFGCWLFQRFQLATGLKKKLALSLAFVSVFGSLVFAASQSSPPIPAKTGRAEKASTWAPYSENALSKMLGEKQSVFIDFTATWCITCQVNKVTTLNTVDGQRFFNEKKIQLMVADYTRYSPEITRVLNRHGRNGVPLYLYYHRGRGPKILPEVLTLNILRQQISEAEKKFSHKKDI